MKSTGFLWFNARREGRHIHMHDVGDNNNIQKYVEDLYEVGIVINIFSIYWIKIYEDLLNLVDHEN